MSFTVQIGEETHTLDASAVTLPEGHSLMTQAQIDAAVEARLARDRKTRDKEAQETYSSDEHFASLAKARGIRLDENLKPVDQITDERRKEMEQDFRVRFLGPKEQELKALQAALDTERRGALIQQFRAIAPESGLHKQLLAVPPGAKNPPFIEHLASQMERDDDKGEWFFKDQATGQPVFTEDGSRYAGPEVLLERMRKSDKDGTYFGDERPRSSGFGSPDAPSTGARVVSKEAFQSGKVDPADVASGKVVVRA